MRREVDSSRTRSEVVEQLLWFGRWEAEVAREFDLDLAVVENGDTAFERTVTRESDVEPDAVFQMYGFDVDLHVDAIVHEIDVVLLLDCFAKCRESLVLQRVETDRNALCHLCILGLVCCEKEVVCPHGHNRLVGNERIVNRPSILSNQKIPNSIFGIWDFRFGIFGYSAFIGLATLTARGRPMKSFPSKPVTAANASSSEDISTKPNPRLFPENLSVMIRAETTVPKSEKTVVRSASVVFQGMLPTNNLFCIKETKK